jgi:uncharacterized LabA/DUF88 family protein
MIGEKEKGHHADGLSLILRPAFFPYTGRRLRGFDDCESSSQSNRVNTRRTLWLATRCGCRLVAPTRNAREDAVPKEYRIHIFVDFWNYTLNMRSVDLEFKTDWRSFPKIMARETGILVDPSALAIYSGMNVYGSYNAQTEGGLKRWAANTLDTFPGVNAFFKERTKKKSPPHCPTCHGEVAKCPACGEDMRGTEEKGIDTRIATDVVSLAWEGAFDVAMLVSADQDFVPAAEYLQNKGVKVIHGGFPPNGMLLRQKCWGSSDIPNFRNDFSR